MFVFNIRFKTNKIYSRRILLDAGQAIPEYKNQLQTAMAKDKLQLQAILITHWHPDHTLGIKDVLKLVDQR